MLNEIYHMLDPVAFAVGPFVVRWYGIAYVAGFLCAALVLWQVAKRWKVRVNADSLLTVVLCAIVGVILGGRLGYVLVYGDGYYFSHPAEILAFNHGGMSFHGGLIGALLSGIVAGLVAASIAWFLGQTSDLLPVVFPFIAKRFGEFAAFLTLGGVTGFGVGFAVSVVDALLGERASSAQLANVLGRGAAKFLVAALPVYAMIRIGGI